MQVIYIIRDYQRMLKKRNDTLYSNSLCEEEANDSIKSAMLSERINGIDSAIHDINVKYTNKLKRKDIKCFESLDGFSDYGYFCYTLYNPEKESEPSYRTWNRFRAEFAFEVAKNLYLI